MTTLDDIAALLKEQNKLLRQMIGTSHTYPATAVMSASREQQIRKTADQDLAEAIARKTAKKTAKESGKSGGIKA